MFKRDVAAHIHVNKNQIYNNGCTHTWRLNFFIIYLVFIHGIQFFVLESQMSFGSRPRDQT